MKMDNLEKLWTEELKDLYDAEKQITEALPKMASKAETAELRQAFEEHLRQTEEHVRRLEEAFEELDMGNPRKKCKGVQGLLTEGEEMMKEASDAMTRDAALIAAAQKVEHYEIAGYGTVVSYAQQLNYPEIAERLQQTLDEEKETDHKLTKIAESKVNVNAE
jgi:ferritin-like metal-binding protein YciE